MASITCSSCRLAKQEQDFSKSQKKKLAQNPNASVVCESCKGNEGKESVSSQPVSILAQAAKVIAQVTSERVAAEEEIVSNDPSLQYFKHPMKAPIVKTFQDFFEKQLPKDAECSTAEIYYNHRKNGWRTASKLPVRSEIISSADGTEFRTKIGLFSPGSHSVIECLSSPIHHPAINHALLAIKQSLQRVGLFGYHESIGDNLQELERTKACVKYLMIAVQRHTHAVQVTFVTQSPRNSRVINPLLTALVEDMVSSSSASNVVFHSIWVNHHYASKHCNTITGRDAEDWRLLYDAEDNEHKDAAKGSGSVIEYLDDFDANGNLVSFMHDIPLEKQQKKDKKRKDRDGDVPETTSDVVPVAKVPLYFPPNVFRQANIGVFRTIVYDIRQWLLSTLVKYQLSDIDCLELYGGVGTIGLHCLDLVRRLVCSDENPNNEACFNRSVAAIRNQLSADLAKRVTYLTGRSADLAKRGLIHQNFDVLIVDPPRKGLEPEVMEQLLLDENQGKGESTTDGKGKISLQPVNKKKIFFDEDGSNATETEHTATTKDATPRTLKRLIYVSCGFEAFQRDCQMLTGDDSIRQAYTVSQTTSYPTLVSSAYTPGMTGTVHTHYHHNNNNHGSDGHKQKKRKTSHANAETVSSSKVEPMVAQLLRDEGLDISEDHVQTKASGKWKLVYAKGYLMFPGANHIETLAIFDRVV